MYIKLTLTIAIAMVFLWRYIVEKITKQTNIKDLTNFKIRNFYEPIINSPYPILKGQARGGIQPLDIVKNDFIWNALLDIEVVNAKPDHLYRLSYVGVDDTNNESRVFNFIFEEIHKVAWINTGVSKQITNGIKTQVKIQPNIGIQTYIIHGLSDKSLSFVITVDTNVLNDIVVKPFVAVRATTSGYCWYINESCYKYITPKIDFKDVIDNNETHKEQTGFGITAERSFKQLITNGQYESNLYVNMPTTLAHCWFQFPDFINSNRQPVTFNLLRNEKWEIPLIGINTFTAHSPQYLDLFSAAAINESGIYRFVNNYKYPIYTVINGNISVLRKLQSNETIDNYSKLNVKVTLDCLHNQPVEDVKPIQYLGGCSASFASKPTEMIDKDWVATDEDVNRESNKGLWVKYDINVSKYVMIAPNATYSFTLEFHKMADSEFEVSLQNSHVKIDSGSLSFVFDAAPLVRDSLSHRIKDMTYNDR